MLQIPVILQCFIRETSQTPDPGRCPGWQIAFNSQAPQGRQKNQKNLADVKTCCTFAHLVKPNDLSNQLQRMTDHDKLTEEKIFESATEVFLDKGMDGARMQDIANHAGINKALLHYYYRTKDRLFDMVFEKIAGLMLKKFAPVFDETLSLEDKIRFFFREHITFLQKNPRLPLFILNELNRNPNRMKRLLDHMPILTLWEKLEKQHPEEIKAMNLTREKIPQLMSTIASISVFPFAARNIISAIMEKAGYDFDQYIEERKTFAADFVIAALKNPKTNPTL